MIFMKNDAIDTHRLEHPPGILWIQLLDISPPDSVKRNFSFGPFEQILSLPLKFLDISSLNSTKGNIHFRLN